MTINKRITFILLMALFAANVTNAQILDSIKTALKSKPKINIKGDNRNSFISTRRARINGVKIMLEYNNKFNYGLGYNFLSSKINKTLYNVEKQGDTIQVKLKMQYIGLFAEYIFYNEKKYQMSIPIQLGLGFNNYEYSNKILNRRPIVIYETSLQGHYKIIPWVGIGLGAGYRIMLLNNKNVDVKLNSPFYMIKIMIFFGDIYNDLFKH
ncbi:MAG: hypothetical protein DRI94_14430 [Bacteroidetes bacterium]|nr:MAG: hypothetical protein DRI94_14430 [Bacteroidota bacterium]